MQSHGIELKIPGLKFNEDIGYWMTLKLTLVNKQFKKKSYFVNLLDHLRSL